MSVPARERLNGDGLFFPAIRGKTQTLTVNVHPFGDKRPLTSSTGGVYGWDCAGCGGDFSPFEVEARFGSGTRTSSAQASSKAELL